MRAPETIRPLKLLAPAVVDEKVVMEVRDGSDVPRVTGQGACAETADVVAKICDDHFDDLQGEPGGRRRAGQRCLRRGTP